MSRSPFVAVGLATAKEGTTVGSSTATGSAVSLAYSTDWGVHAGVPYYAPGAVTPGEEAKLDIDDQTGAVIVVRINPPGAVKHNVDPAAHAGVFLTTSDATIPRVGAAPKVYRRSGGFWFAADAVTTSTLAPATGLLCVAPFEVDRAVTLDQLAVIVSSPSSAGGLALICIYKGDGTMYPGPLVYSGTIAVDTGTNRIIGSLAVALTPGTYWAGAAQQTAAATMHCITAGSRNLGTPTLFGGGATSGYSLTGVTSTAPDPFTAGATITNTVPRIWMHVA